MTTFYPCKKALEDVYVRQTKIDPKTITSNRPSYDGCDSFSKSCVTAYNTHHRLILTPDAVWLSIMTQFSVYLERYAEELRDKFVSFSGQRELTVHGNGSLSTADYPTLIKAMVVQIKDNIKDPSISTWAVPNFTTSTDDDKVVGSLVLMAAMKKYFSFKMQLECGLPEVTLLGTVADWRDVMSRASRLLEFDCKDGYMTKWYAMLGPVLSKFIDSASGNPDLEWWNQIANYIGGGSGPSYYSGWITVFSVFNSDGVWVGDRKKITGWRNATSIYPIIDSIDLTLSEVTVNVTVDDNGHEYKTVFTAGVGGFKVVKGTGIMPVSTWNLAHA